MKDELQKINVDSNRALRNWLKMNHTGKSVWLVTWKKGSGKPHITYEDIVDHCLCFGWIDSLPREVDDKRTMLRISPRNPKSHWSLANKERIARLEARGLMESPGEKLVEQAKKSGTWTFMDDVENLLIPDDLQQALEKYGEASHYFDNFPASSKRNILEWIKSAGTDKTRQKRINDTARKASKNIKANHTAARDKGPGFDSKK